MKKIIMLTVIITIFTLIAGCMVACQENEVGIEYVTVTFCDYDGRIIQVNRVVKGSTPVPPMNPTRPSKNGIEYKFTNWDVDFTEPEEDITVTAVYKSNRRVQIYFLVDGEIYKTFSSGESFSEPIPEKNGYRFDGWYEDENFTEKAYVNWLYYSYLSEDKYLYAKFVEENVPDAQ